MLVSGDRGRFHLDGAVLPAVVRRARQDAGEIPDLQRLGSQSDEAGRNRRRATDAGARDSWRRFPRRRRRRDARGVLRGRPARARLLQVAVRGGRAGRCARTRSATHSRAGRARSRSCPPSPPDRTSMPFRTPGSYDGTVGVLGGLEAIRALAAGRRAAAPLDRTDGLHLGGADALRHRLPGQPAARRAARRRRGRAAARRRRICRSTRRGSGRLHGIARLSCVWRAGAYAAFVELHIEQGPLLERSGDDIGIVTAIAAPASVRVCHRRRGRPRRCAC